MTLDEEWDEVHAHVRHTALEHLGRLGMSREVLDYVGALRLYLRVPFLLVFWTRESATRREVAAELGLHIVGTKLFDDLIDDDSGHDRADLGLCLALLQTATRRLAFRGGPAVLETLDRDFDAICAGQLRTKREPARTLAEWRAHAASYGETFLGCYGRLGALASGAPQAADAAARFAQGFGLIITIADDLRDYDRKGERAGNLRHLLRTAAASTHDVRTLVRDLAARAHAAADERATAYDLHPIINRYADDVIERLLV